MSTDDKSMAQDAAAGVGSDPAPAPGIAASSGATTTSSPCPNPDIATPGTAAVASVAATAALASSSTVHSPPSKSISPSPSPSVPAELTISTTPTTTTAATLPSPSAGPAPASSTDSNPAVPTSLSPSKLPATVAAAAPAPAPAPAPASQSQQNGHSEASEADSDMNGYRPVLTAHNGLPVSYSTTTAMVSTSSHLAAASPPVTSGYASPTGISTAQYASYPASTTVSHPSESYRVSPVPSGNTMSLPSMRTIDPLPQQRAGQPQMPHHAMSISMNSSLTSTSSGPTIYPPHHTMSVPSNYGLPSDSLPRYPLPHDPRILGSRGPKKCDETHPTCNNCKKSKRECLGYDPIFRQQPGAQPNSHIQPAPTGQPVASSSVSPSVPAHSSAAIGHPPAPSNPYGRQPSMLASSYTTTSPPSTLSSSSVAHTVSSKYNSPASASGTPTIKQEPAFDFASPIDPASRHLPPPTGPDIKPYDYKTLTAVDSSHHATPKKMKINEIIDSLGPPPPPQQISHTEETFNEITKVYHEMYAGGLSAFLETTWYYFVDNGKMSFPRDANLIEHMATFLKILEAVRANDHSQMAYSGVLETRIVWELACTAYRTPDATNQTKRATMPPEGDATEARNRLRVVEALLCGEYLVTNPLAPPLQDPDTQRTRQFDFWYSLAEFVRKQDLPGSHQALKAREDALSRMRHLLDGRENRDVLYSIAVVRELAPHYGPSYGNTPQYADETDPKNRLAVASKFILDEAQVTGGTTNVVRRFSDIASRAFVNPGVNVARRTG
ncbi:negative acting factor [Metarhizium acridum CQMa 102]|uniref:Negative acting factor n=1 Tax=Metarhizium acridum (strain CQMa 102) TaxID=655827 RepID=E9EG02_METAQ|nr:negative acting factor [Metarhizium acridum CQMa 102]EFY85132.1 negative acting factor [Metarhizium acridum CQMa 102]